MKGGAGTKAGGALVLARTEEEVQRIRTAAQNADIIALFH
jgi:hypothetical protein